MGFIGPIVDCLGSKGSHISRIPRVSYLNFREQLLEQMPLFCLLVFREIKNSRKQNPSCPYCPVPTYHGRLDGWFLSEQKCFAIIFYPSFHIKTKSKNKRPGRTLYCTVNPPLYCSYQKMQGKKLPDLLVINL